MKASHTIDVSQYHQLTCNGVPVNGLQSENGQNILDWHVDKRLTEEALFLLQVDTLQCIPARVRFTVCRIWFLDSVRLSSNNAGRSTSYFSIFLFNVLLFSVQCERKVLYYCFPVVAASVTVISSSSFAFSLSAINGLDNFSNRWRFKHAWNTVSRSSSNRLGFQQNRLSYT